MKWNGSFTHMQDQYFTEVKWGVDPLTEYGFAAFAIIKHLNRRHRALHFPPNIVEIVVSIRMYGEEHSQQFSSSVCVLLVPEGKQTLIGVCLTTESFVATKFVLWNSLFSFKASLHIFLHPCLPSLVTFWVRYCNFISRYRYFVCVYVYMGLEV